MSGNKAVGRSLAAESARVGLNVALLVMARATGMAMAMVQAGIIFRALPLEGQGRFGAALGFASAFTVPATLGIQRLLVRDIARNPAIAWDYVWTALAATAALSSTSLAAIALLQTGSDLQSAAVWAGVSVVLLWALQQPFESLLMARERLGLVAAMHMTTSIIKLLAIYLFLGRPMMADPGKPGSDWIFTATAAQAHAVISTANGVGLLLCFAFAVRVGGWQWPHLRPKAALAQIRESLPFAAAMLCSWVYFKSDIVLLEFFRGEREAGIYTPPQRLMEPLLMIAGLWGTAIFPTLCRLSHTDEAHYAHLKATSVRLALLLACPMAMGVAVLAHPIMVLLTGGGAALDESARVLQVLAMLTPFFYFNGICQEFLYAAGRNAYTAGSLGVAAAISLTLNLIFIPRFGVFGLCGVAILTNLTVSACFCRGLWEELAAARLGALLIRSTLACAVMAASAYYAARWNLPFAVMAGALVYTALHALLGTLNPQERDMLQHVLQATARRTGWQRA